MNKTQITLKSPFWQGHKWIVKRMKNNKAKIIRYSQKGKMNESKTLALSFNETIKMLKEMGYY